MKIHAHSRARAALLVAFVVTMTTSACTHENPETLLFLGNAAAIRLPGGGQGISGQCYAETFQQFRPQGTFDLSMNNRYMFFPQLENDLTSTDLISGNGVQQLRQDSSGITLTGAFMWIEWTAGTDAPFANAAPPVPNGEASAWYVPLHAFIPASTKAVARFDLIPADVGELMRAAYAAQSPTSRYTSVQPAIIHTIIEGKMQDGTVVQTAMIDYPMEFCWGCLLTLPFSTPGVGAEAEAQYSVCSTKEIDEQFTPPCVVGNDEYVSCTFYCAMCDPFQDLANSPKCDDRFCPSLL